MENKSKWIAMSNLATVIMGQGMTIFGSFVSSQIIHNDHAERFYELEDAGNYNDPECRPELSGRFVIPGDIDVICTKEQYKGFLDLVKSRFYIRHGKKMDMSYRAWMCEKGEYYLYMMDVIMVVDDKYVSTAIDFVVQCKVGVLDLPNKVDCDVNGLLLSYSGLKIHRSVRDFYPQIGPDTYLLIKVLSKILKRECTLRAAVEKGEGLWSMMPERRFTKLKNKGYNVSFKYGQIHFIKETYDGDCLICMQPLTAANCKFSVCDCNYRFCIECMGKSVADETVVKCPMCRTEVHMQLAGTDMDVFTHWGNFTHPAVYKKPAKYLMY